MSSSLSVRNTPILPLSFASGPSVWTPRNPASEKPLTLQRVFNNRHIETLFRDFASIKFFLSRDNIREVLVVR